MAVRKIITKIIIKSNKIYGILNKNAIKSSVFREISSIGDTIAIDSITSYKYDIDNQGKIMKYYFEEGRYMSFTYYWIG